MGDLVTVRTFSGPTARLEADLARNLLQAHDIECFVPGEVSAEILPGVNVLHLCVAEEDGDRAAELLRTFLDEASEAELPPDE